MNNHNFALIGRGKNDWFAGGNSPIIRKILLDDGNWKPIASATEIQVVNYGKTDQYDTSMCITFGQLKAIKYIIKRMMALGLIPQETIKFLKDDGYVDKDGELNFSERFTAVKGETKSYGAYQYKVANAIKNFGLIPQKMFEMADNFNDNIDPKFITEEHEKQGKKFLEHFDMNYEWISDEMTREILKSSPQPCIGQYASGDGILSPATNRGHLMAMIQETDEYREVDDSYWQQFKKYKKDKLQSFMAFYLTPLKEQKNMDTQKFVKDNDKKWVQNSTTGQFGRILQGRLFIVPSTDRASALLLDDKMRTEPSIKITPAEWQELKKADLLSEF